MNNFPSSFVRWGVEIMVGVSNAHKLNYTYQIAQQ